MSDTAAHLVDNVFPHVPVRQWVLSVPRALRYYLAKDARHLTRVLRIFISEVFRRYRQEAGLKRAGDGQGGAVTAVQRFGSFLNLNCHLHDLVLDGLYLKDGKTGERRFRRAKPPSTEELEGVLNRTRVRVEAYLRRRGFEVGDYSVKDPGEDAEPPAALDLFQAASIRERIGIHGDGRRVPMDGRREGGWPERPLKPFAFDTGDGWSVESGVRIRAGDREGLEHLARYVMRPPIAEERLFDLGDGNYQYVFRRPRPDGAESMELTGVELLEKLAALVAPPRAHLLRYHGILGPHAKGRKQVVPPEGPRPSEACGHGAPKEASAEEEAGGKPRRGRRKRTPWAELLRRSFGIDVLNCPRCGDRMKVIACVTKRGAIEAILRALGLPWEAPRPAPARPPPQQEFDFDQDWGEAV
jgi:hypothetical protein